MAAQPTATSRDLGARLEARLAATEARLSERTIGCNRWTFHRVSGEWRIHRRDRRELGAPDQAEVITEPGRAAGRRT